MENIGQLLILLLIGDSSGDRDGVGQFRDGQNEQLLIEQFLYTNFYQQQGMKPSNRPIYALLDNQQNRQAAPHLPSHHPHNYHSTTNSDNISGWDDEKPLLEHNPNTLAAKFNKIRENKEARKYAGFHCGGESRTSHGHRKNKAMCSSASQRNIDSVSQQESSEQQPEALKYEFSNIELLKFQAKHLEKQQISNNRFPTFCAFNRSQIITNQPQENVNQFQISQIYQPSRKLRTESTKRRKRQPSLSQNTGNTSTPLNSTNLGTNQKFYKTLTNEWIHSFKNPHLMVEPMLINYNSTCQSKELKLDVAALIGNKKQEEFKTIHWKRNKPFTKFFQYKRIRSKNSTDLQSQLAAPHQAKCALRQVEGRKLNQLLTMNRQIIQLEEC